MRLRDAVHSDLASRENIDKKIRKHVEHFTNIAARAIQQGMQGVTAELDFDIGYMFKRQPAFKRGISVLKATCPLLTYFLEKIRQTLPSTADTAALQSAIYCCAHDAGDVLGSWIQQTK